MDAGLSIQEKVKCVSRPGITLEEVAQNYDKWAEGSQYDKVRISEAGCVMHRLSGWGNDGK